MQKVKSRIAWSPIRNNRKQHKKAPQPGNWSKWTNAFGKKTGRRAEVALEINKKETGKKDETKRTDREIIQTGDSKQRVILKNHTHIQRYLLLLLFPLLSTSCWKNVHFEKITDIEKGIWEQGTPVTFDIEITDTTHSYRFFYNLRYTDDYPYENFYLTYTLKDSSGNVLEENLQWIGLFDPKTGRPYGGGISSTYDYRVEGISSVSFSQPGTYTFELRQAMRLKQLEGIRGVGLRIEKSNPTP